MEEKDPWFYIEQPLFYWIRGHLLMIEDYLYEGEYFWDDPELVLPEGEEWDELGKKDTIHHVFNFSSLFYFYFVILR